VAATGHSSKNIDHGGGRYSQPAVLLDINGDPLSLGGSGGTSSTDDAAFTAGASSLTPVGGIVTADSVDSGDVGAFAMLANRQQKVTLYDAAGNELAVGGGTQYTEDAAAAANPTGNALIMVRADALAGVTTTDGDNVAARGTDKGELYVKHVDAIPVTDNGGSMTVDGTVAVSSLPASTNTIEVVGDVAHDAVAAGNPLLMGAFAKAAAPTDVSADGDAVRLWADLAGRLQVGDGGGNLSIDDGGNSITVDGAVAVTNAGTFATQVDGAALTALQLIDDPVATLGTTTYTETATKGMIVGAVRRDADTTLVDTTNEVGPLQMDANGRLKVEAFSGETLPVSIASVPSHAVTNAGTFAVQVDGAALTALQLIDDPVIADDAAFTPATSKVMMAGFEFDDAATDSVDEGDAGAARMSANRNIYTQIRDAAGNERGANVNASNQLAVAGPVTNAGTFVTQVDGAALTALQLIDDPVFADDAAFTPGASKVSAVGFMADETATDSVDEGDVGIARMTLDRKQLVVGEQESEALRQDGTARTVKRVAIAAASSGENTLVSNVASRKIRVLSLALISTGTVSLYFNNAADGAVFGGSTNKIALVANTGFVLPHNPHGWFQTGTVNEALRLNLSGAVPVSGGLTYVEVV
jgi:hypothetical protein